MNWRNSSPEGTDRFFAALVYLFPIYYALDFGGDLLRQFPPLAQLISTLVLPLRIIYSVIPFGGFILFIILFAAVVRNPRISHFIRFNAMQAILIDILLILLGLVTGILLGGLGISLIAKTINNTIFLGSLAMCIFAMYRSVSGRYADIPMVSEAAYSQVPW